MTRRVCWTGMVLALVLASGGMKAWAQEGQTDAEVRELRDRVERLERQSDSFQERMTHLDKHIMHAEEAVVREVAGIELAIGATGVVQGTNGVDEGRGGDDAFATVSFDLEVQSQVGEHGLAFAALEAGRGEGVDEARLASISGVNGDVVGDASLDLSEVWYEHGFGGDLLNVRVGQVDLTGDFDTNEAANDERTQFLNGGFINNLAVEFPADNGFGAMLWISPGEFLDVGVGYGDAAGGWDEIYNQGFLIAEVALHPVIAGFQGNYRIYTWVNDLPHVTHNGSSTDKEGKGAGASVDQVLGKAVTLFGRLGIQDEDVYAVSMDWSAGFGYSMMHVGRPDDTFGVALGVAYVSDEFEDESPAAPANAGDEFRLEVYYSLKVNDHLTVTPDIQYLDNVGGDEAAGDVTVAGLRAQLSF